MIKTRIITPLVMVAAIAVALPATAQARSSYCSKSGDVCYGVVKGSSPIKLRLALAAKYFNEFRICLRGPSGQRDCKTFKVRRLKGGIYGRTVKVAKHFEFLGKSGEYKARFSQNGQRLGPAVTF